MTENAYAAFIPEIWSQKLNNILEKECVMLQCVNRNYEGEIKNQGDKVKIITPADVTISTLGSTNISYSELEPTSMELVIDQKSSLLSKLMMLLKFRLIQISWKLILKMLKSY